MSAPVIRTAGIGDGPALAELRRSWTAERLGFRPDDGLLVRHLKA